MSCLARHTSRSIQIWTRLLWSNPQSAFGRTPSPCVTRWTQDSIGIRHFTYDIRNFFFSTEKISLEKQESNRISTTKVASNIELRKIKRTEQAIDNDRTRSLVIILFPFLTSQSVVDKYSGIYHGYGLDVLAVRGRFRHLVHPASSHTLARQLLEYLTQNKTPLNMSRYVFHSVSSGDYLYALVLNEMAEHPRKYVAKRKISGQIFDSLTTGAPTAFPVQTLGRWFQRVADKSTDLYWMLFSRDRDFHEKVLDGFRRGPVQGSASLVFCSFDDQLSNVESVDRLIERWRRERALDVAVSSWNVSKHGTHFHRYPEQYRRAIHTFLTKLRVVPRTESL